MPPPEFSDYSVGWYNQQAKQLIDAAQQGYGQPISPQLATTAISSQSTPDVAAAAASGDPIYGGVIPATPTSVAPNSAAVAVQAYPNNVQTFDQQAYASLADKVKLASSITGDKGQQQVSDLGGPMIPNIGYAGWISTQVQQNRSLAQTWQRTLDAAGMYGQGQDGKAVNHPTDGTWDQASTDAMKQFLLFRFLPDALYNQDAQQQGLAAQFVDQLMGGDFSVQALKTSKGNDATFKHDVAAGWLATQPAAGNPRDSISHYADAYGDAALPQGWADLRSPGFFGNVLNTLGDLTSGPGHLIDMIPGVASHDAVHDALHSALNPAEGPANLVRNLAQGTPGAGLSDAGIAEAAKVQQSLSPEDAQMLAPALQSVQQSQGWLGRFGDWYSRELTRMQLTSIYTMGDALTGKGMDNPFDPASRARVGATLHQDSLIAGLAGDQWQKDHPWESALVNGAANLVDPTLALGPALRLATFGRTVTKLVTSVEEAARAADELNAARDGAAALSEGDRVSHLVSDGLGSRLEYALRPKQFMANAVRKTLPAIALNPDLNLLDLARLTATYDPQKYSALQDIFFDASTGPDGMQTLARKQGLTVDQVTQALEEHSPHLFGEHSITGIGTQYNYLAHLKALSPAVRSRLSSEGINRIITMGGVRNYARAVDLDNPYSLDEVAETVQTMGTLVGLPTSEINDAVNGLYVNAYSRRSVVDAVMQKIAAKVPAGQLDKAIQVMRGKDRGGEMYDALHGPEQLYAPHPQTGEEISTQRRPAQPIDADHEQYLADREQMITRSYYDIVQEWARRSTGTMPSMRSKKQAQAVLDAFTKAPENSETVQAFEREMAELEQARRDLQFPAGEQISRPLTGPQLQKRMVMPFSSYELMVALHPQLLSLEHIADLSHVTEFSQFWKALAIARPSTAVRAMVGDDIARTSLELASMGSARSGANLFLQKALAPYRFGESFLPAFARGITQPVREVRALGKSRAARAAGRDLTPAEFDLARGINPVIHQVIGDQGFTDIAGMERQSFGLAEAGKIGSEANRYHRASLEWWLRQGFGQAGKVWAKAALERSRSGARQALVDFIRSDDPEAVALRQSRGVQQHIAQLTNDYRQKYADLKSALDEADVRTGARRTGNESAYRNLPRVGGSKGTLRDRAVQRLAMFQHLSQTPQALSEWANQFHEMINAFAPHEDWLTWIRDGRIDQKRLDEWYRDPTLRQRLPKVVARRPSVMGQRALLRAANKPLGAFMNHVFGPMIDAGRASQAERMFQWWSDYATHNMPKWAADEVERFALGKTREWMRNNTYQMTRTVGDLATRNLFPFVGATSSMDRFWIRQLRAHPWGAGLAARGGIKAYQAYQDRTGHIDIPGLHFGGGDALAINPFQMWFATSDGIASLVPGQGPVLTMLTNTLRRDAGVNDLLNEIPGLSASTTFTPTILPGGGGAALEAAQSAAIAAGAPAGAVSAVGQVTGGYSQDWQKLIDAKVRQMTADSGGQVPTEAEARKAVAEDVAIPATMNFLFPLSAKASDPRAAQITVARTAYDAAPDSAAKAAVLQQYPQVAPFLLYTDPATPSPKKDAIEADPTTQWVIPYATSMYETKGAKPGSLAEFDTAISAGNEHVLGYSEYQAQLVSQYNVSQGYDQYRAQYVPLVSARKQYLDQLYAAGYTTTSPQYANAKAAFDTQMANVLDGIVGATGGTGTGSWWEKYNVAGRSGVVPQEANSAPIWTLAAWNALPYFNAQRTPTDLAWQQVVSNVQIVGQYIAAVKQARGPQTQVDAAVQQFQNWLVSLEQQYPDIAPQLDLYHWGRWQDFVNTEVTNIMGVA